MNLYNHVWYSPDSMRNYELSTSQRGVRRTCVDTVVAVFSKRTFVFCDLFLPYSACQMIKSLGQNQDN